VTSVKELRQRLATFLEKPEQEQEFRAWFALMLRDAHLNDPAVEVLAHEIMWAFYDQRHGVCTAAELTEELIRLAKDPAVHFGPEPFPVETANTSTYLQQAAAFVFEASQVDVRFASESS